MSRFTPLEEMLNEAWDDPKKREHLRKAVFERIAELNGSLEEWRLDFDELEKAHKATQARLDAVAKVQQHKFFGLDGVWMKATDVLAALEQK